MPHSGIAGLVDGRGWHSVESGDPPGIQQEKSVMLRTQSALPTIRDHSGKWCDVGTAMGTFRIRPHRTMAGWAEMWLDESCWESYPSAEAALAALVRGQIGMGEWRGLGLAFCEEAD